MIIETLSAEAEKKQIGLEHHSERARLKEKFKMLACTLFHLTPQISSSSKITGSAGGQSSTLEHESCDLASKIHFVF